MEADQTKKGDSNKQTRTVLVTRLNPDTSVSVVREHFSEVGPLKKCFLVRDAGTSRFNGLAYVTYTTPEDASKAIEILDGKPVDGTVVGVKFSRHKERAPMTHQEVVKKEDTTLKYYKPVSTIERHRKNGRVIVRNISFNVTEERLKSFFDPYGKVKEVHILKKPDGKSKGVGFVQFADKNEALKVIDDCNTKTLYGRKLSLDLAIPKREYDMEQHNPMDILRQSLQAKPESSISNEEVAIKAEEAESEVEGEESKTEFQTKENDEIEDDQPKSMDEDSGIEDENLEQPQPKKRKVFKETASKDVSEGRTLFVKNINLDSDEQTVKEIFSKYGQVKHVRFCIDHQRKLFKGTAFVEYQKKEYLEECLEAFNDPACKDFVLEGRTLFLMRAISRQDIKCKQEQNDAFKDKKDHRNIYLAREGVVREGTLAARDLSKRDKNRRTQREILKRKLLKNFNTFVSKTRLYVDNFPLELSDGQLKDIFRTHSPENSIITECRIMRNLHDIDDNGTARSKGFGFVSFADHAHALNALLAINNNPTIFTENQRPIVEFSIENRKALQARQNRLAKSQENNKDDHINSSKKRLRKKDRVEGSAPLDCKVEVPSELPSYVGSRSDPKKKGFKALSSHIGPKIRHRDRKISRNAINNKIRRSFAGKSKGKNPAIKHGKGKKNASNKPGRTSKKNTSKKANSKKKLKK